MPPRTITVEFNISGLDDDMATDLEAAIADLVTAIVIGAAGRPRQAIEICGLLQRFFMPHENIDILDNNIGPYSVETQDSGTNRP